MNSLLLASLLRPWRLDRAVLVRTAVVTAAFSVAGLAYGFLAPKWYTATVAIMPARAQRSGLGALSGLLGGDVAGIAASFDALGGGTDVQRIAAVLESNAVADDVVQKFRLMERYDETTVEATREELWSHCSVKPATKPALVQLACEDKEPQLVREMVEYFAERGNEVFRAVSVGAAREEVRYLERRVEELRHEADDRAEKLRSFQEEHRIVDIDSQGRSLVAAFSALQSQRITKQLELDVARSYSNPAESTVRQLASQLAAIDSSLMELQGPEPSAATAPRASVTPSTSPARTPTSPGLSPGLLPHALAVPGLRADYERLFRDRRVAEASLIFALDRLEGARANEARDTSTYQVLDPPTVPTRRSRPRRFRILLASMAFGLLAAVSTEFWRDTRRHSGTETVTAKHGHRGPDLSHRERTDEGQT